MYALHAANGTVAWTFSAGDALFSSPSVAPNGDVFIGSHDSYLYCLEGASGALKWKYSAVGPGAMVIASPALSPPSASPTLVYAATYSFNQSGDVVFAVNAATGALVWATPVPKSIDSSPAYTRDGAVVVGCMDGGVYAFDGATGARRWRFQTNDIVTSSPAVGPDNTVYIGGDALFAINGTTGAVIWTHVVGEYTFIESSPAVDGAGNVFVGTDGGVVIGVSPAGELLWTLNLSSQDPDAINDVHSSPAIGPDGTLFVGSDAGAFFALHE